jgi:uncharacterized protein
MEVTMTATKAKESPEAKKNEAKKKAEIKKNEETLDNALDDSFPASDPPAMTTPTVPGASDK